MASVMNKPKVILSQSFHKRLLEKDLGNIKTHVLANPVDVSKAVQLTNSKTRIVSPLVNFNILQKVQACLKPVTDYEVLQYSNTTVSKPDMKSNNLKFANGRQFIKWVRTFEKFTTSDENRPLVPVNHTEKEYKINLSDSERKRQLLEYLSSNKVLNNDSLQGNEVIFLLQHLNSQQHDVLQQLLQICAQDEQLTTENVITSILYSLGSLSVNDDSLSMFLQSLQPKVQTSTQIDMLSQVFIKYDKLSRAKICIETLLQNNLLPSSIEDYIQSLSAKLSTEANRSEKEKEIPNEDVSAFHILTSGFNIIYKKAMTVEIARSLLPYVTNKNEISSLVKYIDENETRSMIFQNVGQEICNKLKQVLDGEANMSVLEKKARLAVLKRLLKMYDVDVSL